MNNAYLFWRHIRTYVKNFYKISTNNYRNINFLPLGTQSRTYLAPPIIASITVRTPARLGKWGHRQSGWRPLVSSSSAFSSVVCRRCPFLFPSRLPILALKAFHSSPWAARRFWLRHIHVALQPVSLPAGLGAPGLHCDIPDKSVQVLHIRRTFFSRAERTTATDYAQQKGIRPHLYRRYPFLVF